VIGKLFRRLYDNALHTSGNSSIDNSLIRDIYCDPEVSFETCVAMKFVDDDDALAYVKRSVFSPSLNSSRLLNADVQKASSKMTMAVT